MNTSNINCYATADSHLIKTFLTDDYTIVDNTFNFNSHETNNGDLLNTTHIAKTIQLLLAPTQSSDLIEINDNDSLIVILFATADSSSLSTQINRPISSRNELNHPKHNTTINNKYELENFTFFWSSNSPFSHHFLANFTIDVKAYNCSKQFMMNKRLCYLMINKQQC